MKRNHKFPALCLLSVSLVAMAWPTPAAHADAGPSLPEVHIVKDKVAAKAFAFDLNQVQLLDGPFKNAQDLDRRDLLACNADNFLYPFRREAKLPNPGTGGNGLNYTLTGHVVGHYLSAAAFLIRNTGDADVKKKADGMVAALAECQRAIGTGFVGGFPERSILQLEKVITEPGIQAGVPWYCLHKIYAGLLDMYVLTGNKQALEVLKSAADWAVKITDPLTEEQFQAMLLTEHGGMNEVLANLYAVTGDEKYLKLSLRFDHHAILDPFAKGEDSLERKHANTQFPKFIGAARQYELTGNPDLQKIAAGFWTNVVTERSYVTGGNSVGEQFSPKAQLSTTVLRANTTETCNEFNMLRLTRSLFCENPRADYADYFERTLYNQILSSRNPSTGGQLYFQQLQSGQMKKGWMEMNKALQCCFGSGMESNAKYADGIYFNDGKNSLFVNLFVPSVLDWNAQGVKVRQETKYPDEGATRLEWTCEKPTELTVNLRRPAWAGEGFEITINGIKQANLPAPGSYVPLQRTWKTGDVVQVAMPMQLHMEGFKDNPKRAAVMYGPFVMAAKTESGNRLSMIVTEDDKFLDSVKPIAGKPLEFTAPSALFRTSADAKAEPVNFKPLMRMVDESYAVYWDKVTPKEFTGLPASTNPATAPR